MSEYQFSWVSSGAADIVETRDFLRHNDIELLELSEDDEFTIINNSTANFIPMELTFAQSIQLDYTQLESAMSTSLVKRYEQRKLDSRNYDDQTTFFTNDEPSNVLLHIYNILNNNYDVKNMDCQFKDYKMEVQCMKAGELIDIYAQVFKNEDKFGEPFSILVRNELLDVDTQLAYFDMDLQDEQVREINNRATSVVPSSAIVFTINGGDDFLGQTITGEIISMLKDSISIYKYVCGRQDNGVFVRDYCKI